MFKSVVEAFLFQGTFTVFLLELQVCILTRSLQKLRDGRRFELKVNALNRQEAIAQVNNKFPLATIQKVSRADKIRTVERFLDTAERYFES